MTATFRGTVAASALVIDPALLGAAEARRRVLHLDGGGPDLRVLPDGRWLALLPEPVEWRCERAPGLVLTADGGGLAMPGLSGSAESVTWQDGGAVRTARLSALPALAVDGWVDLTGYPVHRLQPLDGPEPPAVVPAEPVRPAPDLRRAAGLSRPRRRRFGGRAGPVRRSAGRRRIGPRTAGALAGGLVLLVVIVFGVLLLSVMSELGVSEGKIWVVLALLALLLAAASDPETVRGRAAESGTGGGATASRPRRLRRVLLRLARGLGTRLLARRHDRYLRSLGTKFERRDWDAALRAAVALSRTGDADGGLWLRRPNPRRTLALRLDRDRAGPAVGDSAFAWLQSLYAEAAARLEAAGRIEEAVFVHGELLDDVPAAVTLLERQGRLRLAAELAEARDLSPALVVRLWWRAGDRDRAVGVARARGAFAAAVGRLAEVDQSASADLRSAWVASCQQAGDHLGAVTAAWPEPELRRRVVPDIEAGIALGGAAAGTLLAYLVSERPSVTATRQALDLLGSRDGRVTPARRALVGALADVPGRDQARDRQLCSAAVRSAYRLPATGELRRQVRRLSARADPLLRADLPPLPTAGPYDGGVPVAVAAPHRDGQLPVRDAVALSDRAVLVAHGDLGARLLTGDGRVRARWDVPADEIVLADNGASAVLLRRAGALRELHRLDLVSRRLRRGPVLRLWQVLPSFDGGTLVTVDDDGIALLDVLADRPRVLWRELDREHRVLRISRTPQKLTALVGVPPAAGPAPHTMELWVWELPSLTLRVRRPVAPPDDLVDAAVSDGRLVLLTARDGDPKLIHIRRWSEPVVTPAPPDSAIRASGAALAVLRRAQPGWQCAVDLGDWPDAVQVDFPDGTQEVGVREHGGVVTLWDGGGRIVAAEPGGAGDLASFATAL